MMKRRWFYLKWVLRTNRLLIVTVVGLLLLIGVLGVNEKKIRTVLKEIYEDYGVLAVEMILQGWNMEQNETWTDFRSLLTEKPELLNYLSEIPESVEYGEDPAYERMLANAWNRKLQEENEQAMREASESPVLETEKDMEQDNEDEVWSAENEERNAKEHWIVEEAIAVKPVDQDMVREKLEDYDYVMKHFYSVHPTTTASRDMIQTDAFLSMDFSLDPEPEQPQILIYHTHSQEEYKDYSGNPDATIVGVGAYLTELLEAKGYHVIHDTTIYDKKDGKLDRSQAYTYALDGITGILQEYPSIEVVLDLHRDGVNEGTHLVTEVNGKPTAQIMFFNGTSQTPDGPIEYLPNPNRQANMAFSFQMQLAAKEQYPGWTRKIYLKGLRYNQHVRARTALVEVGAQTNTYAEALNAMEPFAKVLCMVLNGE